jgi:hypothetical protein
VPRRPFLDGRLRGCALAGRLISAGFALESLADIRQLHPPPRLPG